MDKREVLKIIDDFKDILKDKGYTTKKIILFGSYSAKSREKVREDSDIDMVIISDDFEGLNYWQRVNIIVEIIKKLFYPIDVYLFTTKEWEKGDSMIIDYAKKGEVVFSIDKAS